MLTINAELVKHLITVQFPQWKNLSIKSVSYGGHDNRTFHLGEHMLVRMPSGAEYAAKVAIEQHWLPKLVPQLPLPIPAPLAMGQPTREYPWNWSIYQWIEGETAAHAPITDTQEFARDLAHFLVALRRIHIVGGPVPGAHNFYRGGSLAVYDAETRQAIMLLKDKIDVKAATEIWEMALATSWQQRPVWLHGDISLGNLLVQNGRLSAVIDWGGMAIGDPACDLAIAWTFFRGESREIFRAELRLDDDTWARGRAWALWKALIVAAGITETNALEGTRCWQTIEEIL